MTAALHSTVPPSHPVAGDLLASWGLRLSRIREDLAIPGSPERCRFRRVVEDPDGGLWLLEQLAPDQADRREGLGLLLESLAGRGLSGLAPYRRTRRGDFILRDWGRCWQLSPFIRGVPLRQPDYLLDAAFGEGLGEWLATFRRASEGLVPPAGLSELDLPDYVTELSDRLNRPHRAGGGECPASDVPGLDHSAVGAKARQLLPGLAPLFEAWFRLPRALCHGDVHPLNVVWGDSAPLAVIDWEFAGMRPVLYDIANCLGCLGIEGGGFRTPFTSALTALLRAQELLPQDQVRWLTPMILATRFGWLAEWLRRGDAEMIALELDFMELLARGELTLPLP